MLALVDTEVTPAAAGAGTVAGETGTTVERIVAVLPDETEVMVITDGDPAGATAG